MLVHVRKTKFNVRGVFPTAGVDTLISVGDFQQAAARSGKTAPDTPTTMGVNVARFGDDRTVLCVVRGPRILHVEAYGRQDTVFTASRTTEVAERFGIGMNQARQIAVDDTGVGGGVVDLLRARGWGIRAVNFGEKTELEEDTCANRRTELWVGIRDCGATPASPTSTQPPGSSWSATCLKNALTGWPSRVAGTAREDLPTFPPTD